MSGWKLVPVEPTAEMLAAGQREHAKSPTNANPYHKYAAMLAAAPVPPAGVICDEVAPITEQAWRSLDSQPAGEVEVVAEVVNKYGDPEAFAERDLLRRTEIDKIKIGTELVDRTHVTRLTAENARLQAAGEVFAKGCEILERKLSDAQSELTKARELLAQVQPCNDDYVAVPGGWFERRNTFLAHQSTPAAKGGE